MERSTVTGSSQQARRTLQAGFTLLELMIVISIIIILAAITLPQYQKTIMHTREAVLRDDLRKMRSLIDQFAADKGKLPQSLDELVSDGYMREVPVDPFTNQKDWAISMGEDPNSLNGEQGMTDVHSNSSETSSEGTPYSEWLLSEIRMANLISRIVEPWYPANAIGLEENLASVVQLERVKGNVCRLKRAATAPIDAALLRPSFDEPNIQNGKQLAAVLNALAIGAGLLRQKRWSLTLPETTTRTTVFTIETQPQSGAELQEVLKWKIERNFGAPVEELSISRERLQKDAQGRDRYLAIAVKKSVVAEYERLLDALRWRAGLILPRHLGEAQWLVRNGVSGDSLLLSGSGQGFTGGVFRPKQRT